jgi:hypothetical protein
MNEVAVARSGDELATYTCVKSLGIGSNRGEEAEVGSQ